MTKAIVTDIEGTTSSISFVKDVLFPYAAEHLPDFVRTHRNETSVHEQLVATAKLSGVEFDIDAQIAQLLRWIETDEKATPLKSLQGMVWQHGYQCGAYRAHVYVDAFNQLTQWQRQGIPLYVYSSGSVHAQQLFFQYSEHGDLRPLFQGYFDTGTGAKQDQNSYTAIAQDIGEAASQILFLSDIEAELDAARSAGMGTCWVIRPNDSSVDARKVETSHAIATNFDEVRL